MKTTKSKRGKKGATTATAAAAAPAAASSSSSSPVPQVAGEDSTGDCPSKFYDDEKNLEESVNAVEGETAAKPPPAAAKGPAVAPGKGAPKKKKEDSQGEEAADASKGNLKEDDSAPVDKKPVAKPAKKKSEPKRGEGAATKAAPKPKGGGGGGKAAVAAKKKGDVDEGADDNNDDDDGVSETAIALAEVLEGSAPATARRRSADPGSPVADDNKDAFMSTLESATAFGASKIERKVPRKKGGTADVAAGVAQVRAATRSTPTAVVKNELKKSVLGTPGGRGAAAGVAASAKKTDALRAEPPKRKTTTTEAAPPQKRGRIVAQGKVGGWSGPPDDELYEGFTWPEGWTKELVERKSGATQGGIDAYWYSPGRKFKFRSKAELRRYFSAVEEKGETEAYMLARK